MKVKPLCLLLFLLATSGISAQEEDIVYGKVPIPDILMKSCEFEPDASALVLAHVVRLNIVTDVSSKIRYQIFKRIKILKESAYEQADRSIFFYSKGGYKTIYGLKAMITFPNGRTHELGKDEFFKEDINNEYTQIKFTYPKVEEGAVIEFEYQLTSTNISILDDFYFQEEIPVRYAKLKIPNASRFTYSFLAQNPQYVKRDADVLTMKNIPSMKEEAYITTLDDYRGRIKTQINGYQDYSGYSRDLYDSWDQIIDDLVSEVNYGKEYLKKSRHKKIIEAASPILNNNEDLKTKILQLQEFILDKVAWNGKYQIYSTDGIEKAWEKGEANSSELNLIMLALLRQLDIEAYPMLISTRDHGRVLQEYSFINQFSHSIVYSIVDSKPFLIDVSDKNRPPGIVRFQACNGAGLIINKKKTEWHDVKGMKSGNSFYSQLSISQDTLSAVVSSKSRGYSAISERNYYNDESAGKHWESKLRQKFADAKISKASNNLNDNVYQDFGEELSAKIPNAIMKAGEFMYIDPFIYNEYQENPFKQEARNYPVDFGYPFIDVKVVVLKIPINYIVEEIPKASVIASEDKQSSFSYGAKVFGDEIRITSKLTIKKTKYEPNEYSVLKQLFDLMLEKTGEQIVLKKI